MCSEHKQSSNSCIYATSPFQLHFKYPSQMQRGGGFFVSFITLDISILVGKRRIRLYAFACDTIMVDIRLVQHVLISDTYLLRQQIPEYSFGERISRKMQGTITTSPHPQFRTPRLTHSMRKFFQCILYEFHIVCALISSLFIHFTWHTVSYYIVCSMYATFNAYSALHDTNFDIKCHFKVFERKRGA